MVLWVERDWKKTPWYFTRNVLSFYSRLWNPSKDSRCKNSLHKFHRYITICVTISPSETSGITEGSPSFTHSFCRWNLVNLGEDSKFHTETLLISKLRIGETCEGFFRTFLFKIFIDNTCCIRKIFTFEEIIFLLERCIVKKKTYLCECPAREMAGHI